MVKRIRLWLHNKWWKITTLQREARAIQRHQARCEHEWILNYQDRVYFCKLCGNYVSMDYD